MIDPLIDRVIAGDPQAVARAISTVEDGATGSAELMRQVYAHTGRGLVVGITGAPGAGMLRCESSTPFDVQTKSTSPTQATEQLHMLCCEMPICAIMS